MDTGEPLTAVVPKNWTTHSPGLHKRVGAAPPDSGTAVGSGALTGPTANAGVNASAVSDVPFFGRYVTSIVWVPAVRRFSVSAVTVSVLWEPDPCLNTCVPSIDIDDTSSPVVKKL